MQRLGIEHAMVATVAAAIAALALAEGGFPPTVFAAVGMLVWLLVVVGLATGLLPRAEPPGHARVAGLLLTALIAFTALSMAWASDDGRAFEDVVRGLAYLGIFVLVVMTTRRGDAGWWLRGLAIGLVITGAVALLARYQPSWFGSPDAELTTEVPAFAGRLTYPIGYWNGLGAMMAAAIVLVTWLGAQASTRWGRSAATAALPVAMLALWMTNSRGGLAIAIAGVACMIALSRRRSVMLASFGIGAVAAGALVFLVEQRDQLLINPIDPAALAQGDQMLVFTVLGVAAAGACRLLVDRPLGGVAVPRRIGAIAAGVAAAVIVVGGAVAVGDPAERWDDFKAAPVASELEEGVGLLRSGGSGRYQFWEAATDAFADSPVGGIGTGDYQSYWLQNRDIPIMATRAHSVIFETFAELGLVGLVLLLGFGGVVVAAGVRRYLGDESRPEIAAALAVFGVGAAAATFDWTWDLPAVFAPTIIAAALLCGPATLRATSGEPGPGQRLGTARSRRRFASGVALLAVAWVSICASGLLLLADNRLEASRDAEAEGDTEAALSAAQDAIDLQPWASEPRYWLGRVYEGAGDVEAAREANDEAIARSRRDYVLHLTDLRLDVAAGDVPGACAALARAVELNPLDPSVQEVERTTERSTACKSPR